MKTKVRDILFRYSVASFGLLCVAAGIALSIISNIGISSLSVPAYVLTGIGGLTVGNWTILINLFYVLVQIAILRKRFKLKYLMQIPASLVFGYMIDFAMWCLGFIVPGGFVSKLLLILLACLVTALGVSIEVIAQAWMLSAEMTVYAISKTILKPFGPIKVAMDSILVLVSMVMSFFMFGNPFGKGAFDFIGILTGSSADVAIGIGTILMAVLVGWMMKFTDPIVDWIMDRIIPKVLKQTTKP